MSLKGSSLCKIRTVTAASLVGGLCPVFGSGLKTLRGGMFRQKPLSSFYPGSQGCQWSSAVQLHNAFWPPNPGFREYDFVLY